MSDKINRSLFSDTLKLIQQSNTSFLFQEALSEDSNREDTWLWYAGQVTSPLEKRYCLERALYINPKNRLVQFQIEHVFDVVCHKHKHQALLTRMLVAVFAR